MQGTEMTVGGWAERWFFKRTGKWTPNTAGGDQNLIYNHIIPALGGLVLE